MSVILFVRRLNTVSIILHLYFTNPCNKNFRFVKCTINFGNLINVPGYCILCRRNVNLLSPVLTNGMSSLTTKQRWKQPNITFSLDTDVCAVCGGGVGIYRTSHGRYDIFFHGDRFIFNIKTEYNKSLKLKRS